MNVKYCIYTFLFYFFRLFPVKNDKIVISNYAGKGYGDNGKYICEELLRRNYKFDIVWLINNKSDLLPHGVRGVKYRSIRSIYEQATAKIWIDNRRKREFVRKRKEQYYIMTWHGGIGPKRVEMEAEQQLSPEYVRAAKHDSQMADLFVAESDWTFRLYKRAFWYDGEILKCGIPRQDLLFSIDDEKNLEIRKKIGISDDVNIVLYAPTFRNSIEDCIVAYDLNWDALLKMLKDKFSGTWIGMIRLHPNIADNEQAFNIPSSIINVTDYPDIQELMFISTCVITDYSSSLFEFGVTNRPAFIFASDYDAYLKERSLALDYNSIPFPVAKSNDELLDVVKSFDYDDYRSQVKEFYESYCGLYPGGNASKTITDRIIDIVEERNERRK